MLTKSVCLCSSLPRLIRLWLDEYQEDLRDSPDHQALRLLCVQLRHRLCFRRLVYQADALLRKFQTEGKSWNMANLVFMCTDQKKSMLNNFLWLNRQAHRYISRNQHSCCRESGNWRHHGQTGHRRDGGSTGLPCTRHCWAAHAIRCCRCTDLHTEASFYLRPTFIHLLMFLYQELFVKVVPFHCLGCIWSQRDKKENRNLAPTVRATIAQFNAITNCVITSLLCPPSTSPPGSPSCTRSGPTHRAKIIEKWISVAQVRIKPETC